MKCEQFGVSDFDFEAACTEWSYRCHAESWYNLTTYSTCVFSVSVSIFVPLYMALIIIWWNDCNLPTSIDCYNFVTWLWFGVQVSFNQRYDLTWARFMQRYNIADQNKDIRMEYENGRNQTVCIIIVTARSFHIRPFFLSYRKFDPSIASLVGNELNLSPIHKYVASFRWPQHTKWRVSGTSH